MRYSMYPSYRDSGVEWLGEVPESWDIMQFRRITSLQQGLQIPQEKRFEEGAEDKIEYITIKSLNAGSNRENKEYIEKPSARVQCDTEDVLLARTGATGEVITNVKGVFHNNFFKINYNKKKILKNYLVYLLKVKELKNHLLMLAGTTTIPDLNHGAFLGTVIPLPLENEQQTIANYLDKATAKIDTLIEKQTRLIELLREKRQAVISTAVTRGLDSTVSMKDSGVEWLGEIPEHWDVKKLKYSARIQGGKDQKAVLDSNGDYPVYGSGGIFGYANQYLYDGESVLLGRKGTVDKPLYVSSKFWTVDTMYYTIIESTSIPKWLYYSATTIHFDYYQYGSTVPSMTQEDLHNIYFSTPSKEAQQTIADYLDEKTSKIDTLITKSTKAIDLLKEKRIALISAAVTGKIDVRGIA